MTATAEEIVEILRGRVLRGIQSETLRAGDRLPSGRDLAVEFGADHRVILAAYRQLGDEGLVEMRERGGVYVADRPSPIGGVPPLPEAWFSEILTQALAREIPAPELHEWLRRSTETLRLRAVVVAATPDQVAGLCRELRDDFGLEVDAILAGELSGGATPLPLRRADLIITTASQAEAMAHACQRASKGDHRHRRATGPHHWRMGNAVAPAGLRDSSERAVR